MIVGELHCVSAVEDLASLIHHVHMVAFSDIVNIAHDIVKIWRDVQCSFQRSVLEFLANAQDCAWLCLWSMSTSNRVLTAVHLLLLTSVF